MRNPNGYGSVVKLSGRRRKPYMVRKTAGYDERGYPIYAIIGYAATRAEGNIMLAEYNKTPYDLAKANATVTEVYEGWEKWAQTKLAKNTMISMRTAYNKLKDIRDMRYRDVSVAVMQETLARCTPSMQRSVKKLYAQLDEYAAMNDIIVKRNSEFVTAEKEITPEKNIFTEDEIDTLWRHTDSDTVCAALILIYSGWRVSEYLTMRVDWDDKVMRGGGKTEAGRNRVVPIHPRIEPLLKRLIRDGKVYSGVYTQFYKAFVAKLKELNMSHTIHECRHTFVSRLDSAGVPRTIIDKLAGHKNGSTGEIIYTHKRIDELRDEIIKLR